MTPYNALRMALSDHAGWDELRKIPPPVVQLFVRLTLPLSLLPPVMVYMAGTYHGEAFMAGFSSKHWLPIGIAFLFAEWATVLAMGWVVKAIAGAHRVACGYPDAYVVATHAPVPLWLSSLTLVVPSFGLAALVSLVALALSAGIVYHGARALLGAREEIVAASITFGVIAVGLIAWALLLVLLIPV
jgi:hypothetical protein